MRPYRAGDRHTVRHVCYATGYMGDTPDWYWRDVESFADLWTAYYTDKEPESALVAERPDGAVVGYLIGCVDTTTNTSEFNRLLRHHALRRYCLLRPGTSGFMWRSLADVLRDNVIGRRPLPAPFHDERWPAHLHIDLLPEARAGGVGRRLVTIWLDRLCELGVRGCHVETLAENAPAISFFEATGFVKHGAPLLVPGMRTRDGERMHVQRLVRDLPEAW